MKEETWEEEFDKEFPDFCEISDFEDHTCCQFPSVGIKDFVRSLLHKQAEAIIGDIPEYLVGTKTAEVPLSPTYAPTEWLKQQLRDKYLK